MTTQGDQARGDGIDRAPHYDLVTFEDIRKAELSPWQRNNNALKYLRTLCESEPGKCIRPVYELYHTEKLSIRAPAYTHHTGPAYSSDGAEEIWSWREMLNCMDDATLEDLVGEGIVNMWFGVLPNSYDIKRAAAE